MVVRIEPWVLGHKTVKQSALRVVFEACTPAQAGRSRNRAGPDQTLNAAR
jgi:hypothetical protein